MDACPDISEPIDIADLQRKLMEKDAIIAAQAEQIAMLLVKVAELERRLGLDSSNSGKPPSSDGMKKPSRVKSLREPSGKPSGGQPGHEGKALLQIDQPDLVVDHYPEISEGCGAVLDTKTASDFRKRQVFDLPKPLPITVTEHRAHRCNCQQCGQMTQAAFPADVTAPTQYGSFIAAIVVYLLHGQFIPEDRLAMLMQDIFKVEVSTATIAAMAQKKAREWRELACAIGEQVKQAPVKHLDETGYRIGGKLRWLHVASTTLLTFYRTTVKRGDILKDIAGIIVHDHFKSYYTLEGIVHALCNAHHLRELRALVEIEQEPWARTMYRFLRQACHATNLARRRGVSLRPEFLSWLSGRFDRIIAEGLAFHEALPPLVSEREPDGRKRKGRPPRRTGHNLLLRLRDYKSDVLRFLTDPSVPFTNNLAEQDLRMMKVRQKISGCFRAMAGAENFAVIRTILSTARKQGWNILDTLTQPADMLSQKLRKA